MRLETPRLILRPFQDSDLESFVLYRCDPQVAMYQSWDVPYSQTQALEFIKAMKQTTPGVPGEWYQWAIELKLTGEMIGDCGFCVSLLDQKQAEIGFTLAPIHQHKGFATEAIAHLLNYLFTELNLHRISANCDPDNIASVRLLKRIGMRCEAHFHKSLWFKNQWTDELWFGILRSEWQSLQKN